MSPEARSETILLAPVADSASRATAIFLPVGLALAKSLRCMASRVVSMAPYTGVPYFSSAAARFSAVARSARVDVLRLPSAMAEDVITTLPRTTIIVAREIIRAIWRLGLNIAVGLYPWYISNVRRKKFSANDLPQETGFHGNVTHRQFHLDRHCKRSTSHARKQQRPPGRGGRC